MTSFLNPNLTYDRRAVAREARRIARRGAHLPLSAGAWQRIAWGKARDERNRTIAGWLALRLALALARGEDPTISLLDTLGGIDSRRSQDRSGRCSALPTPKADGFDPTPPSGPPGCRAEPAANRL